MKIILYAAVLAALVVESRYGCLKGHVLLCFASRRTWPHSNYNAPPSNRMCPLSTLLDIDRHVHSPRVACHVLHRPSKVASRILVPPSSRTASGSHWRKDGPSLRDGPHIIISPLSFLFSCRFLAGSLRKKPPAFTAHAFKQHPCFMRPALQLARSRWLPQTKTPFESLFFLFPFSLSFSFLLSPLPSASASPSSFP